MYKSICTSMLGLALVALTSAPALAGHTGGSGSGGHSWGGGGSYHSGGSGSFHSYAAPHGYSASPGFSHSSFASPHSYYGSHAWSGYHGWGGSGYWGGHGWYGGYWGHNWWGVGFYPFWGGWGLGLWSPWWYGGGYYPYYGNDYYPYYAYGGYPGGDPTQYGYAGAVNPENNYPVQPTVAALEPNTSAPNTAPDNASSTESAEGVQFADEAAGAFQQGNYRETLRLASHAAIEMPRSAKIHELISLALFAQGQFRGAAMEAHAAVALGPVSDWAALFHYYGNVETYDKQLEALVKYVRDNPSALDGRFLLAYHNLMMGHTAEGKQQLAQVVAMAPQDKLAAEFLKHLGGTAVTTAKPQTDLVPPTLPQPTPVPVQQVPPVLPAPPGSGTQF